MIGDEKDTGKPRCYLVTVGTSLIGKCEQAKHPGNWSLYDIENNLYNPGLYNPVADGVCTHKDCMNEKNTNHRNHDWFSNYVNAYDAIPKWLTTKRSTAQLAECSAELSSLYRGVPSDETPPGKNDRIILIHTNTPAGCLSSQLLKDILEGSDLISEKPECVLLAVCKGMGRMDDGTSVKEGIPELTRILSDLVRLHSKTHHVYLIPTGGYKSIIPYVTVVGMLLEREIRGIHYIYEDSDKRLNLPLAPLGIALPEWHGKAFLIGMALAGSKEAMDILGKESPRIAQMLREKDGGYELDDFGKVLWGEYHNVVMRSPGMGLRVLPGTGWATRPELAKRAIRFMEEWEYLWEGHPSQHVDHTRAHCHNLIRLLEELLTLIEGFLTSEELYLLTAAIWLHDIGYGEFYQETKDGPKFLGLKGVKDAHHELSAQRIRRKAEALGFGAFDNSQEAQLLALLCLSHRGPKGVQNYIKKLKNFKSVSLPGETGAPIKAEIRSLLLACLLVVLDTCDMGVQRAGGKKFRKARLAANLDEVAATEKMLASIPQDLDCLPEDVRVFIHRYRDILLENYCYLDSSPKHFGDHAKVVWTSFRKPDKENEVWHITLQVHPEESMKGKIVEFVNEEKGWHVKADFDRINEILECNGYNIRFYVDEGEVLDEKDMVLMDR